MHPPKKIIFTDLYLLILKLRIFTQYTEYFVIYNGTSSSTYTYQQDKRTKEIHPDCFGTPSNRQNYPGEPVNQENKYTRYV